MARRVSRGSTASSPGHQHRPDGCGRVGSRRASPTTAPNSTSKRQTRCSVTRPIQLPARCTKGPPQVHPKSVGGRRNWRRYRPAESWFIRGRSLHSAAHVQTRQARAAARRGQSKAIPRYQQGLVNARGSRGPCVGQTLDPPVIFREPDGLFTEDGGHRNPGASGSVNRPLPLSPPPAIRPNAPSGRSMIADAVRYMSVHSRKQPDSHGRSGTSQLQKQQPARRGIPSSRAVSAGSGRCWVRTSVG
jgi:hypothetical protein